MPPEARGITRDAVRMMVAYQVRPAVRARQLLRPPAVPRRRRPRRGQHVRHARRRVDARRPDGTPLVVHLSTQLPADLWVVELRRPNGARPIRGSTTRPAGRCSLPDGGLVELLSTRYERSSGRLWVASLRPRRSRCSPISPCTAGRSATATSRGNWPISTYQNVYATEPGSAEMPSAGRPFTPEVITRLVAKGVGVAPLVLHTGRVVARVDTKRPYPEYYRVAATRRIA